MRLYRLSGTHSPGTFKSFLIFSPPKLFPVDTQPIAQPVIEAKKIQNPTAITIILIFLTLAAGFVPIVEGGRSTWGTVWRVTWDTLRSTKEADPHALGFLMIPLFIAGLGLGLSSRFKYLGIPLTIVTTGLILFICDWLVRNMGPGVQYLYLGIALLNVSIFIEEKRPPGKQKIMFWALIQALACGAVLLIYFNRDWVMP